METEEHNYKIKKLENKIKEYEDRITDLSLQLVNKQNEVEKLIEAHKELETSAFILVGKVVDKLID